MAGYYCKSATGVGCHADEKPDSLRAGLDLIGNESAAAQDFPFSRWPAAWQQTDS
jgi:hypothetical protein